MSGVASSSSSSFFSPAVEFRITIELERIIKREKGKMEF